ncbi:uncharacterized protein PAC_12949 [Phialocephala subalpina]|uniref:DUF6594 domain-containing protein n=1 Tax=Phialocephala subalpina TaxID=576137 RepID=A0A1L7XDG1_9HELO|nr:uncharacterized protein PAC_12949 [Phialocephala subalpina]
MPTPDIELGPQNVTPVRGFALVASKIASDADKTTTIYRRFDELSARNLLFYQAELAELEEQLREYDEDDSKARDESAVECQRDWSEFERSAEEGVVREKRRMVLVMKIREKLEKYHAALAAHQTLLNAPPPSPSTVKALRNWFFNNTSSTKPIDQQIPRLWGASERTYDSIHDLVALRVPSDQDRLSNFIQNNFSLLFATSSPDGNTTYISERSVSHFVAIFSTVLAAIMLFGAIISLYIVKNPHALLGMLSGWTVLFAACVGLLTNARRDQIFGATAAYAAVLVVFVSGNLGGSPCAENCISGSL